MIPTRTTSRQRPRIVATLVAGPYCTPRCRIGKVFRCAVNGARQVVGITDAPIPWPYALAVKGNRQLFVSGGLERAIRRESVQAVVDHWGVNRSLKTDGCGRTATACGLSATHLASFPIPRHIDRQDSGPSASGRTPLMSPKPRLGLALAVVAAFELTVSAHASDQSGVPKLRTLIPRKVASARTRSLECVQKSPDFVLWDRDKTIAPRAVGYVYYREQALGDRLLLVDQSEGARGWVRADTVIPISQAEEFFANQIQANPKSAFAFLMRGVVRLENEDLDHALADLDQALRLDPNYVPALTARAALWQWKNRLDQAIADSSRAIELDTRYSYAYVERGVFHFDMKEYDKALSDFDAAVERGFKGAVIEIGRGMVALYKGDLKKAQAHFNEAQRIDPKHPDAYCGNASIFMMRGDTKRALKVLDQAVEVDPESADSHGNRAVILLSLGQYDKALDDLDLVLKVAPSSVLRSGNEPGSWRPARSTRFATERRHKNRQPGPAS